MALDTPLGAAAKLGRYELLKEQAKSGLGTTWLARSTDDAGDAPLRSLLRVQKSLLKKAELADGLLTEAHRAEALRHPSALQLIEAGNIEGEIFLVTEYAEGEPLAALLTAAGPAGLPLPVTLRVLLDALGAVAAAHAADSICHGELSPQHLLVGVDGVTRVVGFGTARGLARLPLLGAKNGDRLAYAAPERVKSMASPVAVQVALDPRADVFALGVMLWEGVTKQRLFSSKIEAAVIQKVLTAPIAAPGSTPGAAVPAALDAAILKALDRDAANRFQDAGELLAAVEAAQAEVATHAEVAAQVEKLAGKAIAARRATVAAPAARAASAPAIPAPPPPRGPSQTRPSIADAERLNAPAAKLADVKIEAAKPMEAKPPTPKPAEARPTTPKPADAKVATPKPAEAKVEAPKPPEAKVEAPKPAGPPVVRKQTLLGVVPPKPETPKIATKPAAPKPPPPARPELVSVEDIDEGFDVEVGTGSEPPAEPTKAAVPKPGPASVRTGNTKAFGGAPAKTDEVPASVRSAAQAEIKIDAASALAMSAVTKTGPLSDRKTGGTLTNDTPTSDSVTRGKSATAIDKIGPASTLGRYEILTPIARGGMASVWAARLMGTRGFQKLVAVKTMLPDVSDDPDFEQMFLDEARVAARIRHPNVAEILDLGEQDDVLYLVMEWVDGENLSVVLKAARALGGMPLPVILRIASQACAGLHAAHELRDDAGHLVDLIHRDVSPANVLVSMSGFVKLVDFGVAKSKGRMHVTRAGGMVKGKTPYLSPEQLGGLPLDRRSDIFSFGALLYVMATGLHPFRGETEGKTVENIALKNPVPLRTINAALPVEFEKLVLKALEKDPKNRYSTAAELQRALDQIGLTLGEPANESDVADFVRQAIGETQAKRAAEIKSAIATLDALTSGSGDIPRSDALRFLEGGRRPTSSAKNEGENESLRTPPVSAPVPSAPIVVAPVSLTPIPGATAPVSVFEEVTRDGSAEDEAAEARSNAEQITAPIVVPSELDEKASLDAFGPSIPIEVEPPRTIPIKTRVEEDTSPPSTFDEIGPPTVRSGAPNKRPRLIVGAVMGACVIVGILAAALGGGKAAGDAVPEATAAITATPTATATATPTITATPTAATATPPAPSATAEAAPTAEPVAPPPPTTTPPPTKTPPKGKGGPVVKPPVKTTKPPTTKKYNPTGI